MKSSLVRRLLFAGLLVALLGAACPPPNAMGRAAAGPAATTISVFDYWGRMEYTRQVVSGLDHQPPARVIQSLAGLADQWEPVEQVQLANGEIMPVDNTHLLSALRAGSPDLAGLHAWLDALLLAHGQFPGAVFTTASLDSLAPILARPEFQWAGQQPNPVDEWFQKLWNRFTAWLDHLLGSRKFGNAIGQGTWNLLAILAAVLMISILLYAFRGVLFDLVLDARAGGDGEAADEDLTAESAFARAQGLSRGGDYRSAVRYLYLSSLLILDERGLLRYDRAKTNREYLHSVSGSPELSRPLHEVIEVFDNVWYGYHELDEEGFAHYSNRVEELKEKKL